MEVSIKLMEQLHIQTRGPEACLTHGALSVLTGGLRASFLEARVEDWTGEGLLREPRSLGGCRGGSVHVIEDTRDRACVNSDSSLD